MIRRKPPTKVWFSVKTITATEFLVWKVHYSLCIRYFVCALGGYRLAWWIFIERKHCMDVRISGRPIFLPFDDWNNFLLIKNTQKDGDHTKRGFRWLFFSILLLRSFHPQMDAAPDRKLCVDLLNGVSSHRNIATVTVFIPSNIQLSTWAT